LFRSSQDSSISSRSCRLLSGGGTQEIENRYEGKGYKAVKEDVAELVIEALAPLQARFAEYEQYPDTVDKILVHGATSARAISGPMVKIVEEKNGPATALESILSSLITTV